MSSQPRIEVSGSGVGEISQEDIYHRARELAIGDGRHTPHAADLENARLELHAAREDSASPEEIDGDDPLSAEEELTPGSGGHRTPSQFPDEGNVADDLIHEGLDEADHDTRTESGRSAQGAN